MKILILNGPNLNLLGIREKSIYGETSFEEYLSGLRDFYTMVEIDYYQSNVEGELINKIHEVGFSYDGIILNAGAYTHTSTETGYAGGHCNGFNLSWVKQIELLKCPHIT